MNGVSDGCAGREKSVDSGGGRQAQQRRSKGTNSHTTKTMMTTTSTLQNGEELLRTVQLNLDLIYSNRATEEQRTAAYNEEGAANVSQFVESVKLSDESLAIGSHLARPAPEHSYQTRFFGFTLIEFTIKYKWNAFTNSPPDQERLKSILGQLMINGTIPEDPSFIKEKAAAVFVEAVKRLWPFHWQDLDTSLLGMFSRSEKLGKSTESDSVFLYYKDLEFEDEDSFGQSSSGKNQTCYEIIRNITAMLPSLTITWVEGIVTEGFRKILSEQGVSALVDAENDVNATIFEHVSKKLSNYDNGDDMESVNNQISGVKVRLCNNLLCINTENASILRYMLSYFALFSDILSQSPDIFLKVLQRMFVTASFTYPEERDFIARGVLLREDTRVVRNKAINNLIKLATSLPNELATIYPDLYSFILPMLNGNELLNSEKHKFVEFLLTVINGSSIPTEQKVNTLQVLLDPYLQEIRNIDDQMFSSPNAFMQFMGFQEVYNDLNVHTNSESTLSKVKMQASKSRQTKVDPLVTFAYLPFTPS
ncbi:hypothetical protein HDV05_008321 [Chytridiales sp. JEL 0842]|nr:hypothetical protein HDV05_008321 [Chytridiales sp. JEL 0842]